MRQYWRKISESTNLRLRAYNYRKQVQVNSILSNKWRSSRTLAPVAVFHPKPHLDELARAIMVWLMCVHTFDIDGVDIKTSSDGEFSDDAIKALIEHLKWLFFNHGGESDEHPDEKKEQSSVELPLEGMDSGSYEFRARFNLAMTAFGVSAHLLDGCFERLMDHLVYIALKDSNYNGRMLGDSWVYKWVGRTVASELVNGNVEALPYEPEHLRDALRMARQTVIGRMMTDIEYVPGVDSDVEDLVCAAIRDCKDIWWHQGWHDGITILGIIDQLENPEGASDAQKKKSRKVNDRLIRALKELHSALYSMYNISDYGDENIDSWLITQHIVTHPRSQLPFPYEQGMSIDEVIEKLEGMDPKETPNRDTMIELIGDLRDKRKSEVGMRKSCGGDPRYDERTWNCPESFHNALRRLIMFDKDEATKAKFGIERTAEDYCADVIRAWWMQRQMHFLAEGEVDRVIKDQVNVRPVSNNWNEGKRGRPVPMMIILDSSNPRAVAAARKKGFGLVLNRDPNGNGTYVGMDQMSDGDELVDRGLRGITHMMRLVEYREQDLLVPQNETDSFRTESSLADERWYLAQKWRGGRDIAFVLLNGSIHHPDVKRSEIDQDLVAQIVHLVYSIGWMEDEAVRNKVTEGLRMVLKTSAIREVEGQVLQMTWWVLGPVTEEPTVVETDDYLQEILRAAAEQKEEKELLNSRQLAEPMRRLTGPTDE